MRELPMMEQVADPSLEIVSAVKFHYITELIRRADVIQCVGNIYGFCDARLPSDVASCLASSFELIR